jgi:hypothetical protein
MILTEVYNDPAILDIEIPELDKFNFDSYFNLPFKRANYGNLNVEQGRFIVDTNWYTYYTLSRIMSKPLEQITKKLLSMDLIRYPVVQKRRYKTWVAGTADHQGFKQGWHLDNRFIMISGSINIQDNLTSTQFSKKNADNLIYQGRTSKFTGTAWLNTEHTWHRVPQVIEDVRKTLLFTISL